MFDQLELSMPTFLCLVRVLCVMFLHSPSKSPIGGRDLGVLLDLPCLSEVGGGQLQPILRCDLDSSRFGEQHRTHHHLPLLSSGLFPLAGMPDITGAGKTLPALNPGSVSWESTVL